VWCCVAARFGNGLEIGEKAGEDVLNELRGHGRIYRLV
jgi:hypothetical protein